MGKEASKFCRQRAKTIGAQSGRVFNSLHPGTAQFCWYLEFGYMLNVMIWSQQRIQHQRISVQKQLVNT